MLKAKKNLCKFLCDQLPVFSPFVDSDHMNNMAQTSMMIAQPYPAVGQITSPYEQPAKDLNTYATLKAVGKKNPHDELNSWNSHVIDLSDY